MLEDIIKERRSKLERYQKIASSYPATIKRTAPIFNLLKNFEKFSSSKKNIFAVGRIKSLRDQGGIIFADIEDESGRIQCVFNKKDFDDFDFLKQTLDISDFAEINGILFNTQRGEKSVLVKKARIIAKTLRPLPGEWYGLEDTELRLRRRYLDLLTNPDVKDIFLKKSLFWSSVRDFLVKEGFLEVETPVLESVPGGADAEPFVTHHKALDTDFYLRISLEIPLKKLLVGGFEKVFEIGRIFRNEGIDKEHLQDYTQMECYWAYADYTDMMALVEDMYKYIIQKVFGGMTTNSSGHIIDWGKKWSSIDYYEIFRQETKIDLKETTVQELIQKAKDLKLESGLPLNKIGKGRLIDLIYKKVVRPKLIQPCFLLDPPVEIEPLAKRLEKDPDRVARFQILAAGTELGKGFSELNDPIDQGVRFEEQMMLREKGDLEAQQLDEEFIVALEHGMPPAAGFGVSERLFAVLVDKPVRETVFFPLMRPK